MRSGQLRVLWTLALRSLLTHKVSSAIVGSIIFFGTFLVVVGTSLLDSIDRSMALSVTSSVAGHLQVYSAQARDSLALFGSGFMGADDVGEIADFAGVRKAIEAVPNVKAVVPMGVQFTSLSGGNEIDRILARLHGALKAGRSEEVASLATQIRAIAKDLQLDWQRRLTIAADQKKVQDELLDLQRIDKPEFWDAFTHDPGAGLLFLDTHLAPLGADERLVYLRNLGTNLDRFATLFDRFEVVQGQRVPKGKRGFLFSKRVYERQIKNKVARELDAIHLALAEKGKSMARDPELADQAKRLPRQYQRITFQLPPQHAQDITQRLQALLPHEKGDLNALLQIFLTVDDNNFAERYAFFYTNIAPHIQLYSVNIGDMLTMRSFTKAGYLRSVNVKVYGTFQFRGLERSDLAGAENLVDIETFRDLYGFMTAEKRAELADLKREVGVEDLGREEAEAALFGAGAGEEHRQQAAGFDEFATGTLHGTAGGPSDDLNEATLDDGLAINAAIMLHNPALLEQTRQAIQEVNDAQKLGLKVVDWQAASGMVGQFIIVVRIVLYIAIFIIFLVALVIINNAMVLATLERVTEIGTMRAIGAQRGFILVAFLFETLALGLLAGGFGALVGALTVRYFGSAGIPAPTDIMVFLFSGPRLYPTVGVGNLLFGFGVILLVSLASTLYPARIATRIAPITAMQAKE